MREVDPDRTLTADNVVDLLKRITWPELRKRVGKCDEIAPLVKLVNEALKRLRRAPLWGDFSHGHCSAADLNECVEAANARIDTLNQERMEKLRSRSFLHNLLPQLKRENEDGEKKRQSAPRRGRRQRLLRDD